MRRMPIIAWMLLAGVSCTAPDFEQAVRQGRPLVIQIKGAIDRRLAESVDRQVRAAGPGCTAVIFEIDSPGGRLDVASDMSRTIGGLAPVRTIAFVSGWALGSAALVAMSTDSIYMSRRAVIGGAPLVIPGADGRPVKLPPSVEEKFRSLARAEFRAAADAKGHPIAVAEAIADETAGLKKVVYQRKEQYLTEHQIEAIRSSDGGEGSIKEIETVSPTGKVLVLTAEQAVRCGLARKVADDLGAILEAERHRAQ